MIRVAGYARESGSVVYLEDMEKPVTAVDDHRNDPMILSGGMIDSAGISLVFLTKETLGITALLHQFRCRDGLGILLRLRQVDGYIQCTKFRIRCPLQIFFYSVSADIVAVTAEFVVIIRRRLCSLLTI